MRLWSICTAGSIGALFIFLSCSTSRQNHRPIVADNNYCVPAIRYPYNANDLPQANIEAILQADTALTNRYSHHDLVMANAVGILSPLREMINLTQNPGTDARMERVIKQQQIHTQLLVATTQIASIAAELDCEGERADRLATYLDQRDSRRSGGTRSFRSFPERPPPSLRLSFGGIRPTK